MSDVERRDIWIEDWKKANLEAVKASDYDALRAEVERLRAALATLYGRTVSVDISAAEEQEILALIDMRASGQQPESQSR
jgi:predicted nucleotidyltransferase